MSKHIIDDAKRCLQCKNPLCTKGCPVATPIKESISLLLDSRIPEAGEMLLANNPLSLVCSHVCPQENQCEGHCVLGKKGSPVHISAIEEYISDYYLNIYKPKKSNNSRGRVAIIGSGPAGLTIAFYLAQRDYDVTIFEQNDQVGGILRYGIPEFRLPKSVIDRFTERLYEMGVKIKPNATIGANLTVDDLFRDDFKAVFIGTGVWRPSKINIKGESLGHVHYAIEYLRNPSVYNLGKRVAIIGAGNVAMDVARTVFRHDAEEVYILCNKGESTITARPHEVEYAKIDGARFEFYKSAVEFVDGGVMVADTEVTVDEDGYETVTPIPGTENLFNADSVIIAISQGPRAVIVSSSKGIDVDDVGLVKTDESGRTSREGVFASGDVVTGAKTVVEAVRIAKNVANAIDEYIQTEYGEGAKQEGKEALDT
ncbi:MAG TPA: NAD(P)-dependent oxidoreductase [Clostridiaceae bacterium]|nr:NAD(P)-dependent oxidoreductase [Clostridiaceae bacterium]